MKRLVNDYELYKQFLEYLETKITVVRSTLETASDPVQIYKLQGQILAYRRLQKLREEINAGEQPRLAL